MAIRSPPEWSAAICSNTSIFQQRYDIDARIGRALKVSKDFLYSHAPGSPDHNSVDEFLEWLHSRPNYEAEMEVAYRRARRLEQLRIAEDLHDLYLTAGVLLVDAQGHRVISAKIALTVHDTFHAFMLSELDHHGNTTPKLFEQLNIRLVQSVTPRNALGRNEKEKAPKSRLCSTARSVLPTTFASSISDIHRRSYSPKSALSSWRSTETEWCSSCRSGWRFRKITRTGRDISRCTSGKGERTTSGKVRQKLQMRRRTNQPLASKDFRPHLTVFQRALRSIG